LDFYRLKQRGPALVQVEFNQAVWKDSNGVVHVDSVGEELPEDETPSPPILLRIMDLRKEPLTDVHAFAVPVNDTYMNLAEFADVSFRVVRSVSIQPDARGPINEANVYVAKVRRRS
jgi:hypothetical protein